MHRNGSLILIDRISAPKSSQLLQLQYVGGNIKEGRRAENLSGNKEEESRERGHHKRVRYTNKEDELDIAVSIIDVLLTQTSGGCPLGGSVGAAQVNCSPARVFLIGTGDKNSGAGRSWPYKPEKQEPINC